MDDDNENDDKREAWIYKKDQFSITHRYTQTIKDVPVDVACLKETPKLVSFEAEANQYRMYDAYQEDLLLQKENAKKAEPKSHRKTESKTQNLVKTVEPKVCTFSERSIKTIGRLLSQNANGEIAVDFKYWNDPSDKYVQNKPGTLCPLWKFPFGIKSGNPGSQEALVVMNIQCSPRYEDIFAVSIGRHTYSRGSNDDGGQVVLCSFKDPKEPEVRIRTNTAITMVIFHPEQPQIIAYSCANGKVGICDSSSSTLSRSETDDMADVRHRSIASAIAWSCDKYAADEGVLVSTGLDGKVILWNYTFPILTGTELVQLGSEYKVEEHWRESGGVYQEFLVDAGRCICCHPVNNHLMYIGTEEGFIHICNVRYRTHISKPTFRAHNGAVLSLQFNPFDSNYAMTIGSDWSLKIWNMLCSSVAPLIIIPFDLAIYGASWSSYSSVTFGVVLDDRKVAIFNLKESRSFPVYEQLVVGKRARTTSIAFSKYDPIILIGDSVGTVNVLKLSPNLRKNWPCLDFGKRKTLAEQTRDLAKKTMTAEERGYDERKILNKTMRSEQDVQISQFIEISNLHSIFDAEPAEKFFVDKVSD